MITSEKKPNILYEDKDITVIRKPAYFPVQSAAAGKKDCCSFLKNHYYSDTHITDPYVGVIHRLDEPVEGIVVFARSSEAAAVLSKAVQKGLFKKHYLAAVKADRALKKGFTEKLNDWIIKEKTGNLSRIVPSGTPGAKKAGLAYNVMEKIEIFDGEEGYLIGIDLFTGRHHQIRVQMKNAGLPVLGDRKYGASLKEDLPLCLCADHLIFTHPLNGKEMSFNITPEYLDRIKIL